MDKKEYVAPEVVDYGEIEDVTKGPLAISLDDGVLGAKLIEPIQVSGK